MDRKNYEELIRDFPGMKLFETWVDRFYENIKKWKEKDCSSGCKAYKEAERIYENIFGFIWAMDTFGKIDTERTGLLCEEFLHAFEKDGA